MAAESFGSFEQWNEIVGLLETDNSAHVAAAIDKALADFPESLALTLIRALCFHSDATVRDNAAGLIGVYGDERDEYRLLLLSRDSVWPVRCTAASSLSVYQTDSAAKRLFRMAKSDRQPTVRKWAIAAIWDQGLHVAEKLHELLPRETDPFALAGLYGGLAKLGETEYIESLVKLLDGEEPRAEHMRKLLKEHVEEHLKEIQEASK